MPGPLRAYRAKIELWLDEFAQYEDHRHFMAHAIMVPKSAADILFRMYDHREGDYSVGELKLELHHLKALAESLQEISSEFTALVARICIETSLPEP